MIHLSAIGILLVAVWNLFAEHVKMLNITGCGMTAKPAFTIEPSETHKSVVKGRNVTTRSTLDIGLWLESWAQDCKILGYSSGHAGLHAIVNKRYGTRLVHRLYKID